MVGKIARIRLFMAGVFLIDSAKDEPVVAIVQANSPSARPQTSAPGSSSPKERPRGPRSPRSARGTPALRVGMALPQRPAQDDDQDREGRQRGPAVESREWRMIVRPSFVSTCPEPRSVVNRRAKAVD